ncbi:MULTISPECIES: MBL fold metallo-hydrolase [unclassified Prevotella]|uniref:MBL fold metallo-hydrolase n=1 Tax=unclassified Prevotella TaxID=2638335 RepID=UPI0004902455|nr:MULTISPECIES: MBL fold metallo-hydrolase [unclassified Prevotella]
MKLTFLGTGTSCGVPVIGCQCKVCQSVDPKDKRTRCSALVETESTRILIDCGPDFRQQILPQPFRKIDGILITHSHYDHMGGMDDIRPYCQFGAINVYADPIAKKGMLEMLPYCFAENRYPGVPAIGLHEILPHHPLQIGDMEVMPIQVMHGKLPILGYRIGKLAYITDMKTIDEGELPYLEGTELLVVNALRFEKPHHSHQLMDDAIAFARRVGAKRTLIIHVCHDVGLHEEVNQRLPEGIDLAYDGQEIYL